VEVTPVVATPAEAAAIMNDLFYNNNYFGLVKRYQKYALRCTSIFGVHLFYVPALIEIIHGCIIHGCIILGGSLLHTQGFEKRGIREKGRKMY
jgi:hypothetical protein